MSSQGPDGSSAPARPARPAPQARRAQAPSISRPQDLMLHIPRPRLDGDNRPIRVEDYELDRQTLEAALTIMANFIHRHGQTIAVIAVGGAVNTLLLQNRQSTHDVDFFGTNLNNNQRILLDEAARYAEQHSPTPLGGEWFNNQNIPWLPPDVHRTVTEQALQQNEVVFHKTGLKLIAAPWNYAFCGKMSRVLTGDQARPYDLSDAASYLHQYIRSHGGQPVRAAEVKMWCQQYQRGTSKEVLRAVNQEYQRHCRSVGVS